MKKVVFRIRRQYYDAIVEGSKTVEYRKFSPYWLKRLSVLPLPVKEERIAVFICGKRKHMRRITQVRHIPTPSGFSEQGQADVDTATCFAIYLGESVSEV